MLKDFFVFFLQVAYILLLAAVMGGILTYIAASIAICQGIATWQHKVSGTCLLICNIILAKYMFVDLNRFVAANFLILWSVSSIFLLIWGVQTILYIFHTIVHFWEQR